MTRKLLLNKIHGLTSLRNRIPTQRFLRVIREHDGVTGGLVHIARQFSPIQNRLIFKTNAPVDMTENQQLTINSYVCLADVDPDVLRCVEARDEKLIHMFERLFHKGAQLWIGTYGKEVVGICWSRSGQKRSDYFVSLNSDDGSILGCFVFPQFRGRDIYPTMLKCIVNTLGSHNGIRNIFIDCKSWNRSSIRGIEKAGFHLTKRMFCVVMFGRIIFHYPNNSFLHGNS